MSTIGKVLVFFVLVLSVAFLASSIFVLNKAEAWKTKYEAEVTARANDNKNKDDQISKKDAEIQQKTSTISTKDNALAQVQVERDQLNSRLKDAENFKNSVSENIAKLTADVDNFRKANEELAKQVTASNADATKAREDRDNAKKAQEDAENKLAQAEETMKTANNKVNTLLADVKKLNEEGAMKQNALEVYAQRTSIPISEVYLAPPEIRGNVVNVAMDAKLIQLNVGSDGNVKKGYNFTIYRGSEYKGDVIIEEVNPKFATARILTMVKPIAVGDQARSGIF